MIDYFEQLQNGQNVFKRDVLIYCGLEKIPATSNLTMEFNRQWKFFTMKRNGAFLVRNIELRNAWIFLN